ncbi:MAG: LOG family protein [Melioribacteraceae bacterium]|nr:LOG family protein [Melioribacteraceae bacterium]
MNKKFVTVFGSSIPKENDDEYKTAFIIGEKFAKAGLNVCSGGYQGIMDAVSKGCSQNGGEAIGVTLNIYNSIPSKYLTKEIKCNSLFERLSNLIEIGNAYVVLQGGTGTLVELALVWEFINKNMLNEKPIAVHGNMWNDIVNLMEVQIKKEKRRTGLVKCFLEIDDLAEYIINSLK